jgi:hypothetical protein
MEALGTTLPSAQIGIDDSFAALSAPLCGLCCLSSNLTARPPLQMLDIIAINSDLQRSY